MSDEATAPADGEGAADASGDTDPGSNGWTRRRFLAATAAVGGTAAVGAILWEATRSGDGDDDAAPSRRLPKPTLNAAGIHEVRTIHLAAGSTAALGSAAVF